METEISWLLRFTFGLASPQFTTMIFYEQLTLRKKAVTKKKYSNRVVFRLVFFPAAGATMFVK